MEYTKIGNTDIEVSRICLGCMSFGKAGTMHDWTLDENQSEKIISMPLILASISSIQPMATQKEPVRNTLEKR